MTSLKMSGVNHGFRLPTGDWLPILHNIDLTIPGGVHASIVGPSGSGKSTLLNLLGMLDTPSEGEYLLDGQDVRTIPHSKVAKLRGETFGFVFQQFNLLERRTAVENVAAPLLYSGGKRFWKRHELAAEALERVGLGHRLEATPDRLSGGEQQRVAIARALVRTPKVILADEPTGALDVATGRRVMELLTTLVRESGSTFVTITHDPAIAAMAELQFRIDSGHLQVARASIAGAAASAALSAATPGETS